nr:MAG TPA: hypothetical protein [Inoviridae sp.]
MITAPPGSVSGIRYSSLAIWGHRRGAQIARPIPKYQSGLGRVTLPDFEPCSISNMSY